MNSIFIASAFPLFYNTKIAFIILKIFALCILANKIHVYKHNKKLIFIGNDFE